MMLTKTRHFVINIFLQSLIKMKFDVQSLSIFYKREQERKRKRERERERERKRERKKRATRFSLKV